MLLSDLATTLDAQGHFDEACAYVQRASDLARQIEHPELHMLLSNLAAILMHRGRAPGARAGGPPEVGLCQRVSGRPGAVRKLRSEGGWPEVSGRTRLLPVLPASGRSSG